MFLNPQDEVLDEQVNASNLALAEASRNLILATRSIVIDSTAPAW